jgi:ElaB/YqjD/DUF883 family membrane-anchored ribosome-binding protein
MKNLFFKRLLDRGSDNINKNVYLDFEFRHLAEEYGHVARKRFKQDLSEKLAMAQALLEFEEVEISINGKHSFWSADKQQEVNHALDEINYLKSNVEAYIESELKNTPEEMLQSIDKAQAYLSELQSEMSEVQELHTNTKTEGHEKEKAV